MGTFWDVVLESPIQRGIRKQRHAALKKVKVIKVRRKKIKVRQTVEKTFLLKKIT